MLWWISWDSQSFCSIHCYVLIVLLPLLFVITSYTPHILTSSHLTSTLTLTFSAHRPTQKHTYIYARTHAHTHAHTHTHTDRQTDTHIPYSGKFLWDKIFTDFTVGQTSTKIKSANWAFSWFYHAIAASIRENFVCKISFLEPSAKI